MTGKTSLQPDDSHVARLRSRAAQDGRSQQEEACVLASDALGARREVETPHLLEVASRLFGKRHGVDLALPTRRKTSVARAKNGR